MSSTPAVPRVPTRFFYGWLIVIVAMLGLFVSGAGQSHTFSVFLGPVSAELGLTQTQWGFAYGFATLIAALGLPFMGRLTDRFGPKRMLLIVAVLLGFACLAFGAIAGALGIGLAFAALRFLGQGSLALNCANLVSRWFDRKRGFALGLMALGFSMSMAIHPPLAQWLIDQVGWREAWLWMGLSTWLLMLPVVWFFVYNRPHDVGLMPDGTAPASAEVVTASAVAKAPVLSGLTRAQALRTSAFYIICGGLLSLSMLVTSLHLFQVSIFESHGLDALIAARVFPVSAVTMIIAMPLIGKALDRFPTRFMFAFGQLVMVSSLLLATQVVDIGSALVYAAVFGLNNAVTMTLFSYVWPRFFGLAHLGSIQGIGQMMGVVGASIGALPLAIAFDLTGDYDTTLAALTILPALCFVLAFFLKAPALEDDQTQPRQI
jgi:MFS family permease